MTTSSFFEPSSNDFTIQHGRNGVTLTDSLLCISFCKHYDYDKHLARTNTAKALRYTSLGFRIFQYVAAEFACFFLCRSFCHLDRCDSLGMDVIG